MPFDPKSAKKAGKKSKRGPAKKEGPSIFIYNLTKYELNYNKLFYLNIRYLFKIKKLKYLLLDS